MAGRYLPVDAGSMVTDILKTVLLPVVAGLVVRLLAGRWIERVLGAMPWLSSLAIAAIAAVVVAGSADALKSAAPTVLLAVVLHNGCGLAPGYGCGRLARLCRPASRAMAFEVGMQNSGLAASPATAHFTPLAALPAAFFSVWHNISGAPVAAGTARLTPGRGDAPGPELRGAGGPGAWTACRVPAEASSVDCRGRAGTAGWGARPPEAPAQAARRLRPPRRAEGPA